MDPDLKAAHASAPFIVTWDDHEVDNDYAGDRDENDTPPEVFLLRRAAAYQAYFEMMPLRASTLPSGPNMRLYRRMQFGNLIDLTVLDTRQFRSKQACGATSCDRLRRGARSWPHDPRLGPGEVAVRAAGNAEGDVDRARPAGADVCARQHARGAERPLLDGQVGRLRRVARALVRAAQGDEGAESDRAVRRRARALRRRLEDWISPIRSRRPSASSSRTRRSRPAATAPRWRRPGSASAATTRTSSTTALDAATLPARPRPPRCALISRCWSG